MLLYSGGMSYREAGDIVGVSPESIRKWYLKGQVIFYETVKEREEPAVRRLEKLAKEGVKRSTDLVIESVEIVQDISITDALKKPAEIVKKTVGAKAGAAANAATGTDAGEEKKGPRRIRIEEG